MANLNKRILDLPQNTGGDNLDGSEGIEIQKGGAVGSSQYVILSTLAAKIQELLGILSSLIAGDGIEVDDTLSQNPTVSVDGTVARYNATGTFTKSQKVTPIINNTASGTVTPDCAASNTFEYLAIGNLVIANPVNAAQGQFINVLVTQDATGNRTITLGANFKVLNNSAFTITPNAVNMLSGYVSNSGMIYCNIAQ